MKKQDQKPKKTIVEKRQIKYPFSEKELAEKSQQLASCVGELQDLESELKSVKSDYKSKIDAKQALVSGLSNNVRSGFDYRVVECDVIFDYDKAVKEYYYNGILRDTVKMESKDFQTEIPIEIEESAIVDNEDFLSEKLVSVPDPLEPKQSKYPINKQKKK